MAEHRQDLRDEDITPAISCIAELSDGTTIEGVVHDLSDAGARISSNAAGMKRGDQIRLTLVVLADQKVIYEGEVKHVDPLGRFFGLMFTSGPKHLDSDDFDRRKQQCCGHKQQTPFCAYCGRKLIARHGVAT